MTDLVNYDIVKKNGNIETIKVTLLAKMFLDVAKDIGLKVGLNGENPSIQNSHGSVAWVDRNKSPLAKQLNGEDTITGESYTFKEVFKTLKPLFKDQNKVVFNYNFKGNMYPEFYTLELSGGELDKELVTSYLKAIK